MKVLEINEKAKSIIGRNLNFIPWSMLELQGLQKMDSLEKSPPP